MGQPARIAPPNTIGNRVSVHVSIMLALDHLSAPTFTRLYLHRITSVVMSELASCHKEFQYPVMKVLRYKQLDTTCFGKSRDACIVTMLNRIKRSVKVGFGAGARVPSSATLCVGGDW